MKKARILSILLALTLLVSILAACGGGGAASASTPAADTPAASTPALAASTPAGSAEPVELTLGIYPVDTDEPLKAEHNAVIERFKAAYPDVTVTPANYEYALDTFVPLAESGELPVVFTTWFTEPQKIIRSGYAADITDYLVERGWLDQYNPGLLELMSDENGRVYGIPRDAYALGLMINLPMFETAGFKNDDGTYQYPKTWEEVAEFADAIKAATGQQAIAMQGQDNGAGWHFSNIAWNFGANLTTMDASGKVTSNLNTPEVIAAFEYVKSLRWDHDVLLDPAEINWGTGYEALSTGTAAMYIAANDGFNQPITFGMTADQFAIIPMPAGPNGDQVLLNGGTPFMFSPDATPAQINAALDYIELWGKAPGVSDEIRTGFEAAKAIQQEENVPVLPEFPIFTNPEILAMQDEIVAEYSNVDMRLWQDFINMMRAGNVRSEEPGLVQEMYAQILIALQTIFSDPNADCAALAETANDNYQSILDLEYS